MHIYYSDKQNYFRNKKRKRLIKNKNCHKQQTLGATVCTLTSDFKTCHITCKPNYSFHKTGRGVRKSQGALIAGCFSRCLLPSPPPTPPPPLFSVSTSVQHTKNTKKTHATKATTGRKVKPCLYQVLRH